MGKDEFRLSRLPSLKELEARAEKKLGKEPKRPENERQQIFEAICPILERHMANECIKGTAKIHVVGDNIVCEKYVRNRSMGKENRSSSGCILRFKYEGDTPMFDDCPYKTALNLKD